MAVISSCAYDLNKEIDNMGKSQSNGGDWASLLQGYNPAKGQLNNATLAETPKPSVATTTYNQPEPQYNEQLKWSAGVQAENDQGGSQVTPGATNEWNPYQQATNDQGWVAETEYDPYANDQGWDAYSSQFTEYDPYANDQGWDTYSSKFTPYYTGYGSTGVAGDTLYDTLLGEANG